MTRLQQAKILCLASSSASTYRGSKNIRVLPIVVAELKLRNIERQIFAADLVEATNNAALNERPKAFDCVGVDRTDNVLPGFVIDDAMWVFIAKSVIAWIGIGTKQADFVRDCFINKLFECRFVASSSPIGNMASNWAEVSWCTALGCLRAME